MVTIVDVARVAGVSKSTVSRVLDERLPRSQNATAERVRKAAAELGYVRDPLASGLRRVGTSTIGVVVPHLTDTVMAMFYEEIAAAATTRGLFAVVASTNDDPDTERVAVESLRAPPRRRADPHHRPHRHPDPTRTGRPLPAARAGAAHQRHQLRLARRRPARRPPRHPPPARPRPPTASDWSAARRTPPPPRDREAGYRDALTEAGVPVDETLLAGDSFTMQSGEVAGRALLDRPDRPTAIFAVNDNNAIGVMAAAHALGLSVPDDLSLVGYNDIPVVSRLPVPLTTVRVPFPQIAANALELLREAGNDSPPRTLIAAPTLIPRKSATPPR